ncbi:hypothetical protein [Methylorubrum extorquens]
MERSATPEENAQNPASPDVEMAVRLARAEASLEALKEIVELERKRAEELRAERDRWAGIAEASQRQITHLTAKPPEPPAVIPMPAPEPVADRSRGWWPWSRRAV